MTIETAAPQGSWAQKAGAAHMNSTTNSAAIGRRSDALLDLEPRIHELAHMAAIALSLANESEPPPGRTEEQRIEADRILFAITQVERMACDLRKAFVEATRAGAPVAA